MPFSVETQGPPDVTPVLQPHEKLGLIGKSERHWTQRWLGQILRCYRTHSKQETKLYR